MKLLLDECVDQRFRKHLPGHSVFTTGYMNWSGVKNGELLRLAAAEDFDALLTTDRSIQFQHNSASLPVAVVWLQVASNDLGDLLPVVPTLPHLLETLSPRTFQTVAASGLK